jgi:ABC-2 type transport system permease protein
MRVALAFLKRDFLIATSYKTSFVLQFASILFTVPFFYFISSVVGDSQASLLTKYGGSYFVFLLIGIAFTDYLALSLKTFNDSLRESQLMGTLETILLSPTSMPRLLFYSSLWGYLSTTVRFVLYLAVGLLFGFHLGDANALAATCVLVVAIVSFASMGILVAAVTLVIKKGELLTSAVSAASAMLSGVVYPIELLPHWLQFLAKFLPMTYALDGMRLALSKGHGFAEVLPQIGMLVLFSAILLPLGLTAFWLSLRWTKISGTLAQY